MAKKDEVAVVAEKVELGTGAIEIELKALSVLAVGVKKVIKDHKLNAADIPAAMEVAKEYKTFAFAATNAKNVLPEAKDLSTDELAKLGVLLLGYLKQVKEA